MSEIVLVRHGQTRWSVSGQHTSYTEIGLTPDGERQAAQLGARLAGRQFVAVLCSPRQRALRTAALADLAVSTVDDDLVEWHYGLYEGRTSADIQRTEPAWDLWTDGCPGGESPEQVGARIDRLLGRVRPLLDQGDVALIGHGHSLRVAGARWVGLPAADGALFRLDTATLSRLGYEHGRPVLASWSCPV